MAQMNGDFPVTVRGDDVEAELIQRCQNVSIPTPSGQFCSESRNVTVGFSVQTDVSVHAYVLSVCVILVESLPPIHCTVKNRE